MNSKFDASMKNKERKRINDCSEVQTPNDAHYCSRNACLHSNLDSIIDRQFKLVLEHDKVLLHVNSISKQYIALV